MKSLDRSPGDAELERPTLRQVSAPPGWAAAILEAEYPVSANAKPAYKAAVNELVRRLPALRDALHEEVLLQFDRCRPTVEIPLLQQSARQWLPEIGLGVWVDRAAPTLWTENEFLSAAPGQLRPLIYRIFRIQQEPAAQRNAWQLLLGSGVLVRAWLPIAGAWLAACTEALQPKMTEASLTSFPFYAPLLTAKSLLTPDPGYSDLLQTTGHEINGYLRESAEDGGLLLLIRQSPESLREALLAESGIPETSPELRAGGRLPQQGSSPRALRHYSTEPVELPWVFDVG